MAAFNMDNGRHATRAPKLERKPVIGVKVTVSHAENTETAEARRTRHAAETGTTRGMWK